MTQQSETCQNETTPPDIVSGEDMPFDSSSEKIHQMEILRIRQKMHRYLWKNPQKI